MYVMTCFDFSTTAVLVALGQNIGGCLSFTAVMIQINHSVVADDLGKVNGLGQSMASLTRAIGPAIGD